MEFPFHPIHKHLRFLKAVIFVPHLMWETRRDCPSADADQIYLLLSLPLLAEKAGVSEEVLKIAHMYTSITGKCITSALFFAQRTKLSENLHKMGYTMHLQDTVMQGRHEDLVTSADVYGTAFMKEVAEKHQNAECLILFTHPVHCDYYPKVFFDCSGGLQGLATQEGVQTLTERIRWVNLHDKTTGTITTMS